MERGINPTMNASNAVKTPNTAAFVVGCFRLTKLDARVDAEATTGSVVRAVDVVTAVGLLVATEVLTLFVVKVDVSEFVERGREDPDVTAWEAVV
jgi:hypothetical protein